MLLDFNLSRDRQSRSSAAGGTLPYMSPEQIQWMLATSDERCDPPDERADVFSTLRLRFTPPREFNDPFESMPSLVVGDHRDVIWDLLMQEWARHKASKIDEE